MSETQTLSELIGNLLVIEATNKAEQMVADQEDPELIHREIMRGLRLVGERYNEGRCFIADLMVSGMLARELLSLLHDDDCGEKEIVPGCIVIGTIYDDIHDIGKDLISDSLKFRGVDVVDLGVDVPVAAFIAAAEKYRPDILAISTVMDSSFSHIKNLLFHLQVAAIQPDMKIVVGGAAADPRYVKVEGVDCLTNDYQKGIDYCLNTLREKYKQGSRDNG